ncbi:MAG: NACHT domain-containing protein, partial [Gammaproteobacteria bacterium]
SRVFWLTGGPGIGKSAFAAHLCQERPEIKARHFCVHNNADRSDPRKALLSIIYQLSQQLPGYDKLLLELDLAEESRKDTSTIFDNLVVGLLGRIEPPGQTCVVVIDAVDEATQQVAGRGKHNEIAAMIRDHWSKTPPWLRLLITSRPEVEVRTALRSFDPWEFDAKRAENTADLREYLERELRASGFAPTAAQIDTVIARSEGLFLYMKVVVQELREGRLSLARTQDFQRGLAGYYGRYFERQFPDIDRYRERIRGVLQTILAAREPLPLSVLQLSQPTWGTQELADFTQALGSLFVRSKQGSEETLAAFHKSLPDWLTYEAHAGLYFVSAADGHARLGRAGLTQFRGDRAGEMPGYLLRHLPAHLARATLEAERREVLTDFGFA